ncbi:SGNH/GDSL hydrolase family protein [Amaricoccus sp.]|uniref:SGNH/GDSL hydrolase family protein n=1 Tax=Amaricoccus sp. TaxID=1872485 RepID=UPI001B67D167|nr:SGNH/GDSL hydrolase family protein [Amaricoccus sp.]MBP7000168.1 VPLPA-CTERM sorting domain-containing protein [Amaricoccus sp.]
MRIALLACGLAACLVTGPGPAAAASFTSFWAFGDSLTDDGNLLAATGGAVPAPPYWEGRVSNGEVWAEHVARRFERNGLATENFAFAYAAAGDPPPFSPVGTPPVQNLSDQLARFDAVASGRLGKRPVASLWFGANDLFFGGIPTGTAAAVGAAAADHVADGALALKDRGVRDVMIWNLPAIDQTPAFRIINPDGAQQAKEGTDAFNARLDARIAGLRDEGVRVTKIDAHALFVALLDDPAAFGVIDATTPCYVPGTAIYCGADNAPLLAFFDPVHPSSTIHAALAREALARVQPVPLPAAAGLMLAGIAALGFAGRRQGSRTA